uniref:Putative mitochondrial intermediate peptidase isoform X3 n=1 Tax=Rhizophora mucronata TaxID=61149 RepID=A0A2P2M021_RHIMU
MFILCKKNQTSKVQNLLCQNGKEPRIQYRMEDGFHPFQSQCAGDGQPYEPPLTANVHLALLSSPVHIEYDLY